MLSSINSDSDVDNGASDNTNGDDSSEAVIYFQN
jgi:hypothetical protein